MTRAEKRAAQQGITTIREGLLQHEQDLGAAGERNNARFVADAHNYLRLAHVSLAHIQTKEK